MWAAIRNKERHLYLLSGYLSLPRFARSALIKDISAKKISDGNLWAMALTGALPGVAGALGDAVEGAVFENSSGYHFACSESETQKTIDLHLDSRFAAP